LSEKYKYREYRFNHNVYSQYVIALDCTILEVQWIRDEISVWPHCLFTVSYRSRPYDSRGPVDSRWNIGWTTLLMHIELSLSTVRF